MTSLTATTLGALLFDPGSGKPKFPESDSFWMPKSASNFAEDTDFLFFFIYWTSVISTAVIVIAMAYFVLKYRAKGRSSKDEPIRGATHSTALEITWSVIPLVLVVVFFVLGFKGFVDLRTPPKNAMEIQVTSQKWNWTFTYPNGASDNVLHVPLNKPVRLVISSVDVLHSVWIPTFRTKMDAVPGRYTDLWFRATIAGEFPLKCAEYCGTGHSDMLTRVVVHEPGGYEAWLDEQSSAANLPPAELGKKLFEKKGCVACHSTDGSAKVGPTLKGLWGKKEPTNVGPVDVTEDYLRESLLEPQAKIVAGFQPSMPTYQGQLKDSEISALIEFIKTLK